MVDGPPSGTACRFQVNWGLLLAGVSLLVAIGLLSGEVRGIPPRFALVLVLLGTAVATVRLLLIRRPRLRAINVLALVATIVAWIGLALVRNPSAHMLLLLSWVAGCSLLADTGGEKVGRPLQGALLAGLVLILLEVVPGIGLLADQSAGWLSAHLGSAWGGACLGASASGLTTWLGFIAFLAGAASLSRRRVLTIAGLLCAAWLVHMLVQGVVVSPLARSLVKDAYFLLCAAAVSVAVLGPRVGVAFRGRWRIAASLAASLLVAGILVALLILPAAWSRRDDDPRDVLLYDHDMLASWETPADRPAGQAFTGAMFGLLPDYLSAYGHTCRIVESVDEEVLLGQDLVIIINPGRSFSDEERGLLLRFVYEGRALLALGDHTDIGGMKGFFDELLEPAGLELNFDSAVSTERDWRGALRVSYPLSTAFADREIPVSIGASVTARPATTNVPLLVGLDAYSDRGDRENVDGAMLGNLRYDRGEAHGGILLAVATSFGRGKIALFGDTSPFQNGSLAIAYGYTDGLVRWLTDGSSAWLEPVRIVLVVLLLVILVWTVRLASEGILLWVLVALLVGGFLVAQAAASALLDPRLPTEGRLGVIDLSGSNTVSQRALDQQGIDALSVGLSRAGYLPVITQQERVAKLLRSGDLLVSLGVTRSVSAKEAEDLLRRVEGGVDLLLGTQWPEAGTLEPIFGRLGIDVGNAPLGRSRPSVEELEAEPQFGSAWPLALSEGWDCLATTHFAETEYCVGAERDLGEGRVIVVGDVGIFTNEALEGRGYYFPENTAFLAFLLDRIGAP